MERRWGQNCLPPGWKRVNIFPSVLWYWHWFVLKNFPARNIFVFTLALSDLLLAASIPLTLGDALTQVILNIWFTWNWISLRIKYWTTYITTTILKNWKKHFNLRCSSPDGSQSLRSMLTSRLVIVLKVMWWFPVHNALLAWKHFAQGTTMICMQWLMSFSMS